MADKITIFKEVFDYYYDGEITKEQLADLLLMHYETRWGDGVDAKEIEDKDLRMIWRTLQHSVIKSTKNAKQYEKQQNKKSAFQEVKETEFDIPNCQIPNTSVEINNNTDDDMGTFIEYIETPTQEVEIDNFSDVLDKLLDDYESIINHTTDVIAKAEICDDIMIVYQAKQAKIKLKEISEKLIEEIDKTNFYKYIKEKVETKTKKLQVA